MPKVAPTSTQTTSHVAISTESSNSRPLVRAKRARSLCTVRTRIGKIGAMTIPGTPIRTSMIRKEIAKYPVCTAAAISDIATIATRR